MKSGPSLLESSAMWDMMYGQRPTRPGVYGDVSSGSSGYQSGHTGAPAVEITLFVLMLIISSCHIFWKAYCAVFIIYFRRRLDGGAS